MRAPPSGPIVARRFVLLGYGSFVLLGWGGVIIPTLIRSIQRDYRVSDAEFGVLYFLAALCSAIGSLGGGLLTERLGRRLVLSVAALLFTFGVCGAALAPTWAGFLIATVLWAGGAGAIDGGMNGLLLSLYTQARGGALNRLHLVYSAAALSAPVLTGVVVGAGLSWRAIPLGIGIGGGVLTALVAGSRLPTGRRTVSTAPPTPGALTRVERSLLPFAGLAICQFCYDAAVAGVSAWLVRFLSAAPLSVATGTLSLFWGGLALGRLLASRSANRFAPVVLAIGCILLASATLIAAVLAPTLPLSIALFGLAGVFFGPIHPMIFAVGGDLYPHRLPVLSGALGATGDLGTMVYPPLMGLASAWLGIGLGMVGAGLLGIPAALALIGATLIARRRTGEASTRGGAA